MDITYMLLHDAKILKKQDDTTGKYEFLVTTDFFSISRI